MNTRGGGTEVTHSPEMTDETGAALKPDSNKMVASQVWQNDTD